MARYLNLRKYATLPSRAVRGQVRLYVKADETLETVDDEGNRDAVGEGGPITPGPFMEPTEATPEAIAQWLIDNGLMEAS